jgi:hypothetical protein
MNLSLFVEIYNLLFLIIKSISYHILHTIVTGKGKPTRPNVILESRLNNLYVKIMLMICEIYYLDWN